MSASDWDEASRGVVLGRPHSSGLKRYLPRTLFGRTLLIIVTPVVLAQLVATWVFFDRHWDSMTYRLVEAVSGEIAMIIDQLERVSSDDARAALFHRVERATAMQVRFEPDGTLGEPVGSWFASLLLRSALDDALKARVGRPYTLDFEGFDEWYDMHFQLDNGVLWVRSPARRLYSPTTYIFILWMIGSAVVLFAIAIVFMRNQIRPIRRLAIAADRLGKGRSVPEVRIEGATEVRQAASAFLLMRARLKRQIAQRTEMLAGVSHDLRTPLTRMKLQLAMLGPGPELDELRADVAEMETMVEGYLAFARDESGEPVRMTDLSQLAAEVVSDAHRSGWPVAAAIAPGLALPVRANGLKRCLTNLLSNAWRHGDQAWLSAGRRGAFIELTVDDDGPGIPRAQREEVFRPFVRLDSSRNRETGGVGLGLTVARDIVRGMGGEVFLTDSPHGGLRALIRLPI